MTHQYWGSSNLELLGYDCWWQKATEVVCLTLPLCERKSLVVTGIPQQIVTAGTHQPRKKFTSKDHRRHCPISTDHRRTSPDHSRRLSDHRWNVVEPPRTSPDHYRRSSDHRGRHRTTDGGLRTTAWMSQDHRGRRQTTTADRRTTA